MNKIRWIASILLVFFIVLSTNIIDKNNFNRLRYSVTTIYEDRIVASDILFDISMFMHDKEMAIITTDTTYFQKRNQKNNVEIESLIETYSQTKLTTEELKTLNELKVDFENLKKMEDIYTRSNFTSNTNISQSIDKIIQDLHALSRIQIKEARRQMSISDQAMDTIKLFTQFETIFLIVMAILIQIIILYKPKPIEIEEE